MSRSNPKKRKPRTKKDPFLIICEGEAEERFLRRVQRLYCCGRDRSVKIYCEGGGTPGTLAAKARSMGYTEYKHTYLMFDDDCFDKMSIEDKKIFDEVINDRENVSEIRSIPALEALILSILEYPERFQTRSTKELKDKFKREYLNVRAGQRKTNHADFDKLFPKELLEGRRVQIELLNIIISIFSGGFERRD